MNLLLRDIEPVVSVVNYFATSKHATWGVRVLDDYELILIVSGSFCFLSGANRIELAHGDVLTIPPDELHTFSRTEASDGSAVISCIHLSFGSECDAVAAKYGFEIEPLLVANTYGDQEIHRLFTKAHDLFTGNSRCRELLLSRVLSELWLRLSEYWERGGRHPISQRTRQMVNFIEENMLQNLTRHDLAKKFRLTPERVNAIFKDELGTTPSAYINRLRVYHGYNLLSSRIISVKEVALQCGFSDEFYFSRVFKKVMGYAPSRITSADVSLNYTSNA
ncbi:MAG: AraC family transcriptional regulator [Victivallaceae bacterium]|nr:AraC family transcriptional regulator [Victivallaceae bacterium]